MRRGCPVIGNSFLSLLLVAVFLPLALPAASAEDKLNFSGSYKNLFTSSKAACDNQTLYAVTQRLRLQIEPQLTDELSALIAYDNEFILSDFSRTADFGPVRQKNQKTLNFWDADKVMADRSHFYWKTGLYRAYLKYASKSLHCTAGKLAIDWSRMKFYGPLDIFNAVSPLDIERDERIGVDAVNLEYFPTGFSAIQLIYIPHKNDERSGIALKAGQKIKDYDLGINVSYYKKELMAGASFDGYIKDAGLRGEVSFHRPDDRREFIRAAIGSDYNFNPKLYGVFEYFFNGGRAADAAQFSGSYEYSRQRLTLFKHILSAGLEYALSGITKLCGYLFYDCQKKSFFYNPEIRYNVLSNLDFTCGAQLFSGSDTQSEFGGYNNLYYAQLKFYF